MLNFDGFCDFQIFLNCIEFLEIFPEKIYKINKNRKFEKYCKVKIGIKNSSPEFWGIIPLILSTLKMLFDCMHIPVIAIKLHENEKKMSLR